MKNQQIGPREIDRTILNIIYSILAVTLVMFFLGAHGCIEEPKEPSLGAESSEGEVLESLVTAIGNGDPAFLKRQDQSLYQLNLRYSTSAVIPLVAEYFAIEENKDTTQDNVIAFYYEKYEYDTQNPTQKPTMVKQGKECFHWLKPGQDTESTERCTFEEETFGPASLELTADKLKSKSIDPSSLNAFFRNSPESNDSTKNKLTIQSEAAPKVVKTRFYQLRKKQITMEKLGGIPVTEVSMVIVQDMDDGSVEKQEFQISFSPDVPSLPVPTPFGFYMWNVVSHCQRRIENLGGNDYYVSQCYALQDYAKVK